MFADEEYSRPNTCTYIFKRYTSAFQGWLDGGYQDRRMFCEAVNLYIVMDVGTARKCGSWLQEKRLKNQDHVKRSSPKRFGAIERTLLTIWGYYRGIVRSSVQINDRPEIQRRFQSNWWFSNLSAASRSWIISSQGYEYDKFF